MKNKLSFLLNELEKNAVNNMPFVVFRKPNSKIITSYVQDSDDLYELIDFKKSGFVFAPFNSTRKPIVFPLEKCSVINVNSDDHVRSKQLNNTVLSSVNADELKNNHLSLVQKGIEYINSGFAKKIVLSRKEVLKIDINSISTLFKKMIINYKNAFIYCWFHPKIGLWLGVTPEKLLEVSNNTIKTMSLAGTQLKLSDEVVRWDAKELEEQQIVTDFIVSQLKPYINNLAVCGPKTLNAGKMMHLNTDISGEIRTPFALKNIIDCLHPTPAICGVPRNTSLKFILENEGYRREFYTGYLGELNIADKTELFVNLRCMNIEKGYANLYVGGGITAQSDPLKEWEETVSKTDTMKAML